MFTRPLIQHKRKQKMETLRAMIVNYDSAKSNLEMAYADLAGMNDETATEIKKAIQALIDRCALNAVLLDDVYNNTGNLINIMNKAEQYLVEFLASKGVNLKANEVKDFDLQGTESEEKIEEYARDYLSELQTEKSAEAQYKKSGNYYD